jgi:hypothetical protein
MFSGAGHWTLSLNSVPIFAPLIFKADFTTSLMPTVSAKWPPFSYTA